jgi:hypothetical protein
MTFSKRCSSLLFICLLFIIVSCQNTNKTQDEVQSADSLATDSLASTPVPVEVQQMGFEFADLPEAMVLKSTKMYTDTTGTGDTLDVMSLSLFSLEEISSANWQQVSTPQKQMGFIAKGDLATRNDFMPPTIIHSYKHDYVLFSVTDRGLVPRTDEEQMFDGDQWYLLLYSPNEDSLLPVKLIPGENGPMCLAEAEPTMYIYRTMAYPAIKSVTPKPHGAEILLMMGYQDGTSNLFSLNLEEASDYYELTIK